MGIPFPQIIRLLDTVEQWGSMRRVGSDEKAARGFSEFIIKSAAGAALYAVLLDLLAWLGAAVRA
jgi:hypothetical protein